MELIKPNIWDLNWEILLSIVISLICGMILGFEREISNKWAGIRTHMLVCLGSCIFTILSIYGFPIFSDPSNIHSSRFGDPTRIAAQVLTGIGFIGGGTVLRHGTSVFGLTTAATLWVAAAIGMVCACKMYYLALLVTPLVVGVLVLIRLFEKKFLRLRHFTNLEVAVCVNNDEVDDICKTIADKFELIALEKEADKNITSDTQVCAKIKIASDKPINKIYEKLMNETKLKSLSIREINDKE